MIDFILHMLPFLLAGAATAWVLNWIWDRMDWDR